MRLLIVTPAPVGSTKGNRITAERWAEFLQQLGHEVLVAEKNVSGVFDCLIALHATRSHEALVTFQNQCSNRPIILCLTGTDLHLDLQQLRGEEAFRQASDSVDRCDRIVLLQPQGAVHLPEQSRGKVTVILQSAIPVSPKPIPNPNVFEISVVGHLRAEKDPFLAALAARLLPADSKILITHLGSALQSEMEESANKESNTNPRYQWLKSVPHDQAQQCIACSRLMVLTSKVEGAPSAISEAIVNGVPILATKIPATLGLLGEDYPGLFPVGNEKALANLMRRTESEPAFLEDLTGAIEKLAPQFTSTNERAALDRLMTSVFHRRQ